MGGRISIRSQTGTASRGQFRAQELPIARVVQVKFRGRLFQFREMPLFRFVALQQGVTFVIDPGEFLFAWRRVQHHVPAIAALHQPGLLYGKRIVHFPACADGAAMRRNTALSPPCRAFAGVSRGAIDGHRACSCR